MYDIVVMGSVNLDIIVNMKEFPKSGDNTFVNSIQTAAGGKGNNQAVSAAKFGKKVAFIGCLGNDDAGKQLRDNMKERGIDDSNVIIKEDAKTGSCVCLLEPNGENTLLVNLGANFAFDASDVRNAFKNVDAKILMIQMETSKETIIEAMKIAHEKGMYVILDPAPVSGISVDCLSYADLIVPNSNETKHISGVDVYDEETALKAAKIIHKMGVKDVIIKMGGNGCLLYKDGQHVFIPAIKVKAVDTVGAGDCFAGALANYLIDHSGDIEGAIRFAQVVAGIKVSRSGGHDAIPSMNEVLEMRQKLGV